MDSTKKRTNIIKEMNKHLEQILSDIKKILEDGTNNYVMNNIDTIELMVNDLKKNLNNKELISLDLKKIKELSNMIYDLNCNNNFSTLTDHISNELYAFEFLLQEELKRKEV